MSIIDNEKGATPPPITKVKDGALSIPQLRVLEVLHLCGGLMSRVRISKEVQKSSTYVGRVIGYSDPEKRKAFRNNTDLGKAVGVPLLDRGYVTEIELDVDGLSELCIQITPSGRQAYKDNRSRIASYDTEEEKQPLEKKVKESKPKAEPKPKKPKTTKKHRSDSTVQSFARVSYD